MEQQIDPIKSPTVLSQQDAMTLLSKVREMRQSGRQQGEIDKYVEDFKKQYGQKPKGLDTPDALDRLKKAKEQFKSNLTLPEKKTKVEPVLNERQQASKPTDATTTTAPPKQQEVERSLETAYPVEENPDPLAPYKKYASKSIGYINEADGVRKVENHYDEDFLKSYFPPGTLKQYGIDPEDFDGFLNSKGFKKSLDEMKANGAFSMTDTNHDPELTFDQARLNIMNKYYGEKLQLYKSQYEQALKLNRDSAIPPSTGMGSDQSVKEALDRYLDKARKYQEYVKRDFPAYGRVMQNKQQELQEKYYDMISPGVNGANITTWGRGVLNGAVSSIHSIVSTIYDKLENPASNMLSGLARAAGMEGVGEELDFKEKAEKLRYQKKNEQLTDFSPDELFYTYKKGKEVYHNGVKYLVDDNGDVYDTNEKLKVTGILKDDDFNAILNKAQSTSRKGSSFSTRGAMQELAPVIGDMAVQVAVQAAVGRLTGGAGLAAPKLMAKEASDAIIAQAAYGYSNMYENAYQAARDEGKSQDDAEMIASEAGRIGAAVYGATAHISPQFKLLQTLEGTAVKTLVRKGIQLMEKEGVEGYRKTIQQGVKDLFTKDLKQKGMMIARGAYEAGEEGVKEVFQENIQQALENGVINANTNIALGDKVLKEDYNWDDIVQTSIMAFGAASLMQGTGSALNSIRTNDKLDILDKLSQNRENAIKSIDNYVNAGFATKDQAAQLKKDIDTYSKYSNQLPKNVTVNKAMDVMNTLSEIDRVKNEMAAAHESFKPQFKEQLDALNAQLTGLTTPPAKPSAPEAKKKKSVETTTEPIDTTITQRDQAWDEATVEALPDLNFESEDEFKHTLQHGEWGMLTAENPNSTQVSDQENFERSQKAIEWLENKGYNPQPIFGKYGNSENSLFVEGLTREDAIEFMKEFQQTSVATHSELLYNDGTTEPRVKGEEKYGPTDDYYTTVKINGKPLTFSLKYATNESEKQNQGGDQQGSLQERQGVNNLGDTTTQQEANRSDSGVGSQGSEITATPQEVFTQAAELWGEYQDASGNAKKRETLAKRRELIASHPLLKAIDDNIKSIHQQLSALPDFSKTDGCP